MASPLSIGIHWGINYEEGEEDNDGEDNDEDANDGDNDGDDDDGIGGGGGGDDGAPWESECRKKISKISSWFNRCASMAAV